VLIAAFSLIVLLASFHREILLGMLIWFAQCRQAPVGVWNLKVTARSKRRLKLYLMKNAPIETLCFNYLIGSVFFVTEELWHQLSDDEKEALYIWMYARTSRRGIFESLFTVFNPSVEDRDVPLTGGLSEALLSAIEIIASYRNKNGLGFLGEALKGLSFLGPSYFGAVLSKSDRESNIGRVAKAVNSR
jgi:hypothetical protein